VRSREWIKKKNERGQARVAVVIPDTVEARDRLKNFAAKLRHEAVEKK
jgi:hypothetical protein